MALTKSSDAFNPDVPDTKDPNYIGLSKPIETPNFISTTGEALKDVSKIFTSAVQGTDEVIKSFVRQDVQNEIAPMKDQNINDLQSAKDAISGKYASLVQPTPVQQTEYDSTGAPQKLIPDEKNLPRDIQQLPRDLSILDDARANGKISQTHFLGEVNNRLSDIRSRYPQGYRDYVDKISESVLGFDAANARRQSLIADLNAYATNAQKEQHELLSFIRNNDNIPGAAAMYRLVQNGMPDAGGKVLEWAAPIKQATLDYELSSKRRAEKKGNDEEVKQDYENDFNRVASSTANAWANSLVITQGVNNPATARQLLEEVASGKRKLSASEARQAAEQIRANEQQYRKSVEAEAFKAQPNGSFSARLGKKAYEIIDTHAEVFRQVEAALENGERGWASRAARIGKAAADDFKETIYDNPNMRRIWAASEAAKDMPEAYKKTILEDALTDKENLGVWKELVQGKKLELTTQSHPDGTPQTMSTAFDELKALADKKGVKAPAVFSAMTKLVHGEGGIVDPNLPTANAKKLVVSIFGPGNGGLIDKIDQGGWDPDKGGWQPGQYRTFKNWTSPAVADRIKQVTKDDPAAWKHYQDWVEGTHAKLFTQDMKDFQEQLRTMPKGAKVAWNSETNQFGLTYNGMPLRSLQKASVMEAVKLSGGLLSDVAKIQTVGRNLIDLNDGIESMTNIARDKIKEPSAYVIQLLLDNQVDLRNVDGLPRSILDSIEQSTLAEEKAKAARKKYEGRGK